MLARGAGWVSSVSCCTLTSMAVAQSTLKVSSRDSCCHLVGQPDFGAGVVMVKYTERISHVMLSIVATLVCQTERHSLVVLSATPLRCNAKHADRISRCVQRFAAACADKCVRPDSMMFCWLQICPSLCGMLGFASTAENCRCWPGSGRLFTVTKLMF